MVYLPGEVIPDGHGQFIATWVTAPQRCDGTGTNEPTLKANHAGTEYSIPIPGLDDYNETVSLVLGGNDTGFAMSYDANNNIILIAFDINSGSPTWSRVLDSGYVAQQFIAATSGGGLVIQNGSQIVRFDSTGTSTTDAWSTSFPTFVAGDAFLDGSIGNLSLVASGVSADFAAFSPWAVPQADNSSDPKIKINLSVSNVYVSTPGDIQTDATVITKVNNARTYWSKKARIQLNWDGSISPVKSCDPVAYPNGCGGNVQLDIAQITSQDTAQEFRRRFCGTDLSTCTPKDSRLVFNDGNNIGGIGHAEGYTPALPDGTKFLNISAVSSTAVEDGSTDDSSSHDIAHELGHQFQLRHVWAALPSNLMCEGLIFCHTHAGGRLGGDQVIDAQNGAKKLE